MDKSLTVTQLQIRLLAWLNQDEGHIEDAAEWVYPHTRDGKLSKLLLLIAGLIGLGWHIRYNPDTLMVRLGREQCKLLLEAYGGKLWEWPKGLALTPGNVQTRMFQSLGVKDDADERTGQTV